MAHIARPRCLVLGLDGVPHSLVHRLPQGTMPNLASLLQHIPGKPIQAELPELSPVNWTSFYTAAGPETHGVYGFTALDPRTYQLSTVDATRVQAPTLFDRLGQRQLVSKVINLPNTYPARPLKGMLIAGFVAPDLENAVFPKVLLPRLQEVGYKLEADTERGRQDFDLLLAELRATISSRRAALDLFWPDLAWDLFVLVLTEFDRLGHFLFPALVEPDHVWRTPCLELLRVWDRLIGEVVERYQALPEPKRLLVLADHGFTGLITEVDLNAWLAAQGLLHLDAPPAHELDGSTISTRSAAFALDPGRIYLHQQDRFARGRMTASEAVRTRAEIATALQDLTFEGQPVIDRVLPGEELYPGAASEQRPDLVALPVPGFGLTAKFDRTEIFGCFGRQGTHTAHDVLFADSAGSSPKTVRGVGQAVLDSFQEVIAVAL